MDEEEIRDDITQDLTEAFDQAGELPKELPEGGPTDELPKEEPPKEEPPKEEPLKEEEPPKDELPKDELPKEELPKGDQPKDEGDKAPAGWKPEVREKWADLPQEVRSEINRHATAYSQGIQQYAERAKLGDSMTEVLSPYRHLMEMEGGDSVSTVAHLARQAAVMRQGTPQEKAQMVSNLIQFYAVDVPMLDGLLSGDPALPPEQQALMDQVNQRLKPLDEMLSRVDVARQQTQQSNQGAVTSEIQAFSSNTGNEFFEDVRGDMADLLELSAKRGESLTMQEAYDKACRMNPNIQSIVATRGDRQRMADQQVKIEAKKTAASSVPGGSGGGTPLKSVSIEDELSQAWAKHALG